MSEMLVWREKIQKIYTQYSIYIDKMIRFFFSLAAFLLINRNIGMMTLVASPIISVGLAVLCAFMPAICSVLLAAAIVLLHMYELSLGVMAVSAAVFFIMFAFYCQFTPKRALLLLITPIACMLKIPYAVSIVCGLLCGPTIAIPVVFGIVVHYILQFMKSSASAIVSAGGIMNEITLFVKTVFLNKEMWVSCFAAMVCICAVYVIRRLSIEYAWTIAIVTGAVVNVVLNIGGMIMVGGKISYITVLLANVAAVMIGIVVQFFAFHVDYSRTETIQFEDDEYYYYVKAVPKVKITEPDKVVKHISNSKSVKENNAKERNTEQILLEKSLREELEFQDIIEQELGERY